MFGVSPALLIDCARQIHEGNLGREQRPLSLEDFSKALGAPASESVHVLRTMVSEGFFEQRDEEQFVSTKKLAQLALSSVSRGLTREEATALISRITEKATWVNARPEEYKHCITCVVVFGSWLGNKHVLGDLDIGVAVAQLRSPADRSKSGDVFTWLKLTSAARQRTLNALRLRQPGIISLHSLDEVISLGTPYQVIFGALPERQSALSDSAEHGIE